MKIEFVELVGSVCEILGAFLMANGLLRIVRGRDVPKYLWSALFNGTRARGFSWVAGIAPEQHGKTLRGLAFITLGFALKLAVIGWRLVADYTAAPPPLH